MMILDDDTMEHCEEWVTGVIYIGGLGVALGYYQDEERTTKQFVAHPRTGERLFRTGDLGRIRPGGLLEILGREDSQVKLNGFRIELGEVESAMLQLDSVSSVCASVHQKAIVAHLVPSSPISDVDKSAFVQSCREQCIAALPEYMVPKFFVVIEQMPLSPNGKVQRNKLPPPEISDVAQDSSKDVVLPSSPLEKQIAACFAQTLQLGHDLIDVNTSFFSMGGNSLTSLHLLMVLKKKIGIHLNVAEFFGFATVAKLASEVANRSLEGHQASGGSAESSARLFSLQDADVGQDPGAPHFMLHGAGASGLAFRPLVAAMNDTSRSVFAVEDASLNGSIDFEFGSIVEVAEAYGNLVLAKLKELGMSRCFLSGWSYGGVVSVEVARKLEASGIKVEMLSLFDAPIRGPDCEGETDEEYAAEEAVIREGLKAHVGDGASDISRLLTERAVGHWKNCIGLLRKHRTSQSPRLTCKTCHFVVKEGSAKWDDAFLDNALVEKATVRQVDGLHWSMLSEEHVAILAHEILLARSRLI